MNHQHQQPRMIMEEEEAEQPSVKKILRRSIHIFLSNFHHLTYTPTLLALPFSLSVLFFPTLLSSPNFLIHGTRFRLHSFLSAASFPYSSFLSLKLSETLVSSIVTLPLSLSFLLLAKSAAIHFLRRHSPPSFSSLLRTQICNSLVLFGAHSASLSLIALAFSASDALGSPYWATLVTLAAAVFYSTVVANAVVLCNLGIIVSGCEKQKAGLEAILEACLMLRARRRNASVALVLALPANVAMAAGEWLFHYRVVLGSGGGLSLLRSADWSVAVEGVFIGYLYSVFIVLDVIVGYLLYLSCKEAGISRDIQIENEEEEDEYGSGLKKLRAIEEGSIQ